MEIEKARQFLQEHHRAIMLTYRRDGRPQLSPVNVGLSKEGEATVSTRETAYKTRNLRRDPRVSLCVFTEQYYGKWIQIDGTAEIVSLPEAMEMLVDYYQSTYGEHPDWDEYREAMVKEKRVIVRVRIERCGPDRRG